jgi:hypothetical protein
MVFSSFGELGTSVRVLEIPADKITASLQKTQKTDNPQPAPRVPTERFFKYYDESILINGKG